MTVLGQGVWKTIPDPAIGMAWVATVPKTEAWRIWAGGCNFHTSATVATRTPSLRVTNRGYTLHAHYNIQRGGVTGPTASSNWTIVYYRMNTLLPQVFTGSTTNPELIGLPTIWIPPLSVIIGGFENLQPGDQVSSIRLLVETASVNVYPVSPATRMAQRQAAGREIIHTELGTYGKRFTPTAGLTGVSGVSKYGQAGWGYDITEAAQDGGVQTQDWDLAATVRKTGLFTEADASGPFNILTLPTLSVLCRPETLGTNGTAVASWTNEAGGAALAQATGSLQPLVAATILDGKSVVRFDGVDDFLSLLWAARADRTVFIVAKQAAALSNKDIWGVSSGNFSITTTVTPQYQTNDIGVNLGGVPTAWNLITWRWNGLTSADGFMNGGSAVNENPTDSYATATTFFVAQRGNSGAFMACDVAEVIVCDSALADSLVQNVWAYLSDKYPTLGQFGTT